MPIYLGANKLEAIHLGAGEISKVYLGQTLVYQKGSGPTPPSAGVLFDHGWVTGISWAGNQLPRPRYTSIASYNFANVEQGGYMALTVDSNWDYSNVNQNCHVCVNGAVTVPAGATYMKVTAAVFGRNIYEGDNWEPYIKFGVLTGDCVNSCDATNGGQLSEWADIQHAETELTFTLTLNAAVKGQALIPVVNLRRTAGADYPVAMRIYKVWFE